MDVHPHFLLLSSNFYTQLIASRGPPGTQGNLVQPVLLVTPSIQLEGGSLFSNGCTQGAATVTASLCWQPHGLHSHTPGICPWMLDQKLWSDWRGRVLRSCLLRRRSAHRLGKWCLRRPRPPSRLQSHSGPLGGHIWEKGAFSKSNKHSPSPAHLRFPSPSRMPGPSQASSSATSPVQ